MVRKSFALLMAPLLLAFLVLAPSPGAAATIELFDYAFYDNGALYSNTTPAGMNTASFDLTSGLGTLTYTISSAGANTFIAFFDHEIDEATNTFFNEYGTAVGAPASGQSWEIDEPGYGFGDIYTNVTKGALDNTNAVPSGSDDDVSLALGWSFTLSAGEYAMLTFVVSDTAPASGFYLTHTDPDSEATLYFYSTLIIKGISPVPLPGSLLLLGSGLLGLMGYGWRRRQT
jgi:hypothetical protein